MASQGAPVIPPESKGLQMAGKIWRHGCMPDYKITNVNGLLLSH